MSKGATTLQIKILADATNARSVFTKFARDVRRLFKQLNISRGSGTTGNDLNKVVKQVEQVAQGIKRVGRAADTAKKKTLSWTAQLNKDMAVYRKLVKAGADPVLLKKADQVMQSTLGARTKELSKMGKAVSPKWIASLAKASANVQNLTGSLDKMFIAAGKQNKQFNQMSRMGQRLGFFSKDILKSRAGFSPTGLAAVENEIKQTQAARTRLSQALRELRSQGFRRPSVISDRVSEAQRYTAQETRKWGGATTPTSPRGGGVAVIPDKDFQRLQKANMITKELVPRMGRIREFFGTVKSFIKMQLGWFAAAGIIFGLVGAFRAAVRSSLDFYQSLKDIQAITGVTDKAIGFVSDAALKVARTTPIAANEAAKMGLKLIQAGLSARETAAAMQTVAAITTVSGEDMVESSKAVTTAMFAWKLTAEDIPDIGNKIAAAMNFSRLTVEDLSTSFNYLAATSSIMGRSLAETVTNMSVISNMGVRASTIGTGLRQMYARLISPTREFEAELIRLTKASKDVNFSLADINPTMNTFADIVRKLTALGFDGTKAFKFLGARAGNILATGLVAGAEAFDEMAKKIEESTQLSEGLATAMEGPINALKLMRNEAGIAAVQLGSILVPALVTFTQAMKAILSVVSLVASGISALASVGGLFAVAMIGAIPIAIYATKVYFGMATAMATVAASTTAARRALEFFKVVAMGAAFNPYIVAILAISTILAAIGVIASKSRKQAQKLAAERRLAAKGELEDKNDIMFATREAQKQEEAGMNLLREQWAETAIDRPTLGVISYLKNAQAEINKTSVKIAGLKKEIAAFASENISKALDPFSNGDLLGDYGAAAGSGVMRGPDYATAALRKKEFDQRKKENEERKKEIERQRAIAITEARVFLESVKTVDLPAIALNQSFENNTRTGVARMLLMYDNLKAAYTEQTSALNKLIGDFDTEIDPVKKTKLEGQIKASVAAFKVGIAERTFEVVKLNQIITKTRRRAGESASNALKSAGRGLKDLAQGLQDLSTFNPFKKLRDRAAKDIRKIMDEVNKLESKLVILGKERTTEAQLATLNKQFADKHGYVAKNLAEALALRKSTNKETRAAIKLLLEQIKVRQKTVDLDVTQSRAEMATKSSVATLKASLGYLKTIKASKMEILKIELALLKAERERINNDKELSAAERRAEQAALKKAILAKEKLKNEDIRATTDPLFAINLGFKRTVESWIKASDYMRKIGEQTATGLRDSFSNIFFDGMQGELKSFGDYWNSFWKSLGRVVSDMLAEMLVKFIKTQATLAAGQYKGAGGGGSGLLKAGLGLLGGIFGGGAAASGGSDLGGGNYFLTSHSGGLIPRYHSGGLAADERMAILQTGEYVVNRKATSNNLDTLRAINNGRKAKGGGGDVYNVFNIKANDAKSFDEMVRRNPRSITTVVDRDLRMNGDLRGSIQAYT